MANINYSYRDLMQIVIDSNGVEKCIVRNKYKLLLRNKYNVKSTSFHPHRGSRKYKKAQQA